MQAELGGWRACTQARFRKKYHLEDFIVPVDYLLNRTYTCKVLLSMCLVDQGKAFDTVNQAWLLEVLQGCGVGPNMLEAIHHLYINTRG